MFEVEVGATDVTIYVYFVDDDGGTAPGEPTTGLLFSNIETGGSASTMRQGAARADFALVTQTVAGAHTDGGFIEVDATNMPGVYRLDLPDVFATGANFVIVHLVAAAANNSIIRPVIIRILENPWDADATGHQTQGTFGQAIGDPVADATTIYQAVATDATGDNVAVDIVAVKAETVLIVADTGELQVDDVPGLIATAQADLNILTGTAGVIIDPSTANDTTISDAVWDELQAGHVIADSFGILATEIAAIPLTAMRGTDGVDTATMRGTDSAALASVLGALADAAAADEVTATDTLMAYLKQLINILIGTPGIATFKAEAAPANAVSLSEVIRAIHADVTGLAGAVMRGTDSALLASSAPTNFGDLNIVVTTGLVNITQAAADKVFGSGAAGLPELTQAIPPTTPRPDQALMLGYMPLRNKLDVTATTKEVHNDAGTQIARKALTDDTTTYSEAKMIAGT